MVSRRPSCTAPRLGSCWSSCRRFPTPQGRRRRGVPCSDVLTRPIRTSPCPGLVDSSVAPRRRRRGGRLAPRVHGLLNGPGAVCVRHVVRTAPRASRLPVCRRGTLGRGLFSCPCPRTPRVPSRSRCWAEATRTFENFPSTHSGEYVRDALV